MAGSQQHDNQQHDNRSAEQAGPTATAAGDDQGGVEIRLPFLTIT